jgi:hypothetical protein
MALCYVMTTLLQDLGLCAYYKRRDKEAITLYIEACRGIVDKVLNLLLNLLALPVKGTSTDAETKSLLLSKLNLVGGFGTRCSVYLLY